MPCDSKKSNRGFSLFEIMVVLAIVGMMMGIVIVSTGSSAERNLKKTSNRLASTIRYLYNKSAIEGIYIKLILDMEERSYWVEATSDPVALERKDDTDKKSDAEKLKDKKKTETSDETKTGKTAESDDAGEEAKLEGGGEEESGEGEPEKLKPPEPEFSQVDSFLLRPTKLPSSVFFKDVQVEHRSAPVEGGRESIYFFPNGYVEKAVINLRDEKDDIHYSIATNPISGRVTIENQQRNLKSE